MAGLVVSGPAGKECRIGRRDFADARADEQGRLSLPSDARAARGAAPTSSLAGLLRCYLCIDFLLQLSETFIGPSLLFEGQALFYVIP